MWGTFNLYSDQIKEKFKLVFQCISVLTFWTEAVISSYFKELVILLEVLCTTFQNSLIILTNFVLGLTFSETSHIISTFVSSSFLLIGKHKSM